jgi:hypothetical protein
MGFTKWLLQWAGAKGRRAGGKRRRVREVRRRLVIDPLERRTRARAGSDPALRSRTPLSTRGLPPTFAASANWSEPSVPRSMCAQSKKETKYINHEVVPGR